MVFEPSEAWEPPPRPDLDPPRCPKWSPGEAPLLTFSYFFRRVLDINCEKSKAVRQATQATSRRSLLDVEAS